MNPKQRNKLIGVLSIVLLLGMGAGLVLYALKQNINLFYTPTELLQATINPDQPLRIGGYVKKNSVHYDKSGEAVTFVVTDRVNEMMVNYQGVLPNLFREGQTVVVTGKLNSQHEIIANQVLAKHDERYMPKPLKNLSKGDGYGT
jgi:cytochrome c-type biogenesis protein CcmE